MCVCMHVSGCMCVCMYRCVCVRRCVCMYVLYVSQYVCMYKISKIMYENKAIKV